MQVKEGVTASVYIERVSGTKVAFRTLCTVDARGTSPEPRVVVDGTALALIPQASLLAYIDKNR